MNILINAVGRDDEMSLSLVVAYWLDFISTCCERVSEAAVVCNSGTVDILEQFGRPKERHKCRRTKVNKYGKKREKSCRQKDKK